MSGAPARGTAPRRQRRHHHRHHHHHHHQKHQKHSRDETPRDGTLDGGGEAEEKRPKVNPIFLWASQREQRIVEVRCEDYDKRNRIKLTKTAQGWRSIPRTTSNVYSIALATANACKTKTPPSLADSPAASVLSNDEKENGKRCQEAAPIVAANSLRRLPIRKYPANGATNGLLTGVEGVARKRRYDDTRSDEKRREYPSPLGYSLGPRDDSKWKPNGQGCSEDEDNDDESGERKTEDGEIDPREPRDKAEDRLSSLRSKHKLLGGRVNLERLQKDKLFQPRVVLEQLHLSQLPESAHQNVVRQVRERKDETANEVERIERNGEDDVDEAEEEDEEEAEKENEEDEEEEVGEEEEEEEEEEDSEKRRRVNKAGIQDILNMIDATASPVLATDTPSADLPVDSTKTYEVLGDGAQQSEKRPVDVRRVKETNSPAEQSFDNAADYARGESTSNYPIDTVRNGNDDVDDDKLEVHEEKILEDYSLDVEENKIHVDDKVVLLSLKSSSETMLRSCKVAEADGGFVTSRSRCRSNSLVTWQSTPSEKTPTEAEEEAPDEPGDPMKIDYNDSSKILDALRNTPGLSVSVTRNHTSDVGKSMNAPPARPSSKASSSSRSPDSQAECVEKMLKNGTVDSATNAGFLDSRGRDDSPHNLPGLSIIIPSYRFRSASCQLTTTSPSTKRRVESPESTVSFNKADAYPEEMKADRFPHEEEEDDEEDEEDDEDLDDCDSQVLEDLRRQRADSLAAHDSVDAGYYNNKSGSRTNQEERKISLDNAKSDPLWIGSSRSSEAQAKCKYQNLEHFDEQVLEELRSRGTVVSPQPSGIPCSPASRRHSSAYLERLLPSPPCSVSCSEDAKNELTLKSILASSSCVEPRDHERSKEGAASIRADHQGVDFGICRPAHSNIDKNTVSRRTNRNAFQERLNVHNQEAGNSGRPMSSGDIHSNYYTADRAAPKRPMSAEWSTGRQRSQTNCYQRLAGRTARSHLDADHLQDTCATSSSTDKLLDPASQLRELIETTGHLIPDPLLVPRDYLPGLAAAPATEIPKLLATRPELRLPEALTRPDLLRDPDLLVITLAHLQHVLDHGEGPVSRSRQPPQARAGGNHGANNSNNNHHNHHYHQHHNRGSGHGSHNGGTKGSIGYGKPKLSCKPIGTLMPAPIDLSSSRTRVSPYPPLLRVRNGLLKQEPEVSSTANSPDESQLWHPLFGSQKRQQQQQQQQQQQHLHLHQHPQQQQSSSQQHASWHRTTLAS